MGERNLNLTHEHEHLVDSLDFWARAGKVPKTEIRHGA